MSVRKTIPNNHGLYFITLTCVEWLWLFEIINGYDIAKHYLTGKHGIYLVTDFQELKDIDLTRLE
jgi:hypothetical protein